MLPATEMASAQLSHRYALPPLTNVLAVGEDSVNLQATTQSSRRRQDGAAPTTQLRTM